MFLLGAILLALLYWYISKAIYKWVCNKTKNKKLRVATIILLIFVGFGDNIVGNIYYYYLVKTKGGERIYETIEKVPGFMLETDYGDQIIFFKEELFSRKYGFIEMKLTKNNLDAGKFTRPWNFAKIKGYYRFTSSESGDYKCKNYEEYRAKNKRNTEQDTIANCLAMEEVSKIMSKYIVIFDNDIDYKLVNIKRVVTIVKEIDSGRHVAEVNNIYYAGGWYKRGYLGYLNSRRYPDDINGYAAGKKLIDKVLTRS